MNFKPLENEEQYIRTKEIIKDFEEQIESNKNKYKNTDEFVLFTEMIYYTKHILEAEVQNYEHIISMPLLM
jgi:hypothetical protein